ncbi:hypothetical protein L3V86_00030 [Thiotrichales bacterium 19S11-10]|nr:hypothetical protein [Thiotrichales bacterium 19S11-10]
MGYYEKIKEEKDKIVKEFTISKTGAEDPTNPENQRFIEYRKQAYNYDELDKKLMELQASNESLDQYYEELKKIKYANCTSQALFLCNNLIKAGIDSKVFYATLEHNMVISKSDISNQIIISDAWYDGLWIFKTTKEIQNLDDLDQETLYQIITEITKNNDLYAISPQYYNEQKNREIENKIKEYSGDEKKIIEYKHNYYLDSDNHHLKHFKIGIIKYLLEDPILSYKRTHDFYNPKKDLKEIYLFQNKHENQMSNNDYESQIGNNCSCTIL